jgi:hypothetical protein
MSSDDLPGRLPLWRSFGPRVVHEDVQASYA